MATIGTSYPTLIELAATEGEKILIEILNQKNDPLAAFPWLPCNDGTGHKTKIRTGLPTSTFRQLYGYVQPNKGTFAQVRDACGNMEQYAECDKMEYELQGENAETWRLWENAAHIEGMSQDMMTTILYGNAAVNPEKFTGIMARYNSLSAENADNIVDAGGSGSDNTSILLLGLGQLGLHGIYPKGMTAGLRYEDLGQETKVDPGGGGGLMQVMRTHYQWTGGISLRDWRSTGRICNIDVSDIRGTTASMTALVTSLINLCERVEPVTGGGRQFLVANKTVRAALRRGILEKVSSNLTFETVAGKPVMRFDEFEIMRCDALSNAESRVT